LTGFGRISIKLEDGDMKIPEGIGE